MPALSFTANNSTNELTITAHGLLTGDGPVTPFTETGVLPAPLVALTDYWVIKIDNDKIKLATSQANAIALTAIDLTTDGSGTRKLLVGIPHRRATTYVGGVSQLKSADLNVMQDSLVAIWNLLTGQSQSLWTQAVLAIPVRSSLSENRNFSPLSGFAISGTWNHLTGIVTCPTGGGGAWVVALDGWRSGDRILSVSFKALGNDTTDLVATVYHLPADHIQVSIGTATTNNVSSGSWTSITINVTDTVISDYSTLQLHLSANGPDIQIGNAVVTFDHPAQ